MLPVRWAEEATADLVEIIDYIEQRNPLAAQTLHATVVQAAENIPQTPFLMRPGRVAGTREYTVHPNYILVYQVGAASIDVLRVLHARRQYP
ncbi:type II toxin-antitoxin system RelE/ParE family toxin [Thiomonas sp.]